MRNIDDDRPEMRLDKSAFEVVPLSEAGNDLAYWLSKTPEERLAAVEYMRQMLYGYDPTRDRLQRVLEITELK